MKKVKITQEQEKALKKAVADFGSDGVMSDHVGGGEFKNWGGDLDSLNDLFPHQLARALYVENGYEVKPEFKAKDIIVAEICGDRNIGEIKRINIYGSAECDWLNLDGDCDYGYGGMPLRDIRHATSAECEELKRIKWWGKHDRDVWELRKSDVLVNKGNGKDWLVISDIREVGDVKNYIFYSFITGESEIMHIETIKKHFQIVCFSEDRKDVGENK